MRGLGEKTGNEVPLKVVGIEVGAAGTHENR